MLPFLLIEDVIRLKKVCLEAFLVCRDYLKEKCVPNASEIEINEASYTFSDFLKDGIPYSHIYINNDLSRAKFFDNFFLGEFLRIYGARVEHIRIAVLGLSLSENEQCFYERLKNLKSLEIENFSLKSTNKKRTQKLCTTYSDENVKRLCNYQSTFENIDRVVISIKEKDFSKKTFTCSLVFPQYCKKLKTYGNSWWCNAAKNYEMQFEDLLHKFANFCVSKPPFLKNFDMCNWNQIEVNTVRENADAVNYFLEQCLENDIKLINFHSVLLEVVNPFVNSGANISSLQNVHSFVQVMQMNSLTEITAISSQCSSYLKLIRLNYNTFANLERIKLIIDSIYLQNTSWFEDGVIYATNEVRPIEDLLLFLFCSCVRLKLHDIYIGYDAKLNNKTSVSESNNSIAKIVDLSRCCPNLSKLTLFQWPGTNKWISKIWTGLPHLQDVCFDHCNQLGNVAFIGENVEAPLCFCPKSKSISPYLILPK